MKLRFSYAIWKQCHLQNWPINFHDYQALDGKTIDFGNKACVKVNGVLVDKVWCEPIKKVV